MMRRRTTDEDRDLARALAMMRMAVGAAMVLVPGAIGRRWVGPDADRGSTKAVIRGFGMRDLALGVALAAAADEGRSIRRLVQLSAACDAADAAGIVMAGRHVPTARKLATFAVASAAVAAGVRLADRVK